MEVVKEATLTNKYGLHARPATLFVETCNRYPCDVVVIKNGQAVNGKSIMGVMMLGADCGTTLTIKTTGPEAEAAADALVKLIQSKFGEAG